MKKIFVNVCDVIAVVMVMVWAYGIIFMNYVIIAMIMLIRNLRPYSTLFMNMHFYYRFSRHSRRAVNKMETGRISY
jgi:hypothetical protein